MKIILDGKTIGQGTPNEVWKDLQKILSDTERVPHTCRVNGQEVVFPSAKDILEDDSMNDVVLDVVTADQMEMARNALDTAMNYLPKVAAGLKECTEKIEDNEVPAAMEILGQASEGLQWFFAVMFNVEHVTGVLENRKSWEAEAHDFNHSVSQMETAMEEQDWILVSDFINFEWIPRTLAWGDALPQWSALLERRMTQSAA